MAIASACMTIVAVCATEAAAAAVAAGLPGATVDGTMVTITFPPALVPDSDPAPTGYVGRIVSELLDAGTVPGS